VYALGADVEGSEVGVDAVDATDPGERVGALRDEFGSAQDTFDTMAPAEVQRFNRMWESWPGCCSRDLMLVADTAVDARKCLLRTVRSELLRL
jgi:hypothetical protein